MLWLGLRNHHFCSLKTFEFAVPWTCKGVLAAPLTLAFENVPQFLSFPVGSTALIIYMYLFLSTSKIWDIKCNSEGGKKLHFWKKINLYKNCNFKNCIYMYWENCILVLEKKINLSFITVLQMSEKSYYM